MTTNDYVTKRMDMIITERLQGNRNVQPAGIARVTRTAQHPRNLRHEAGLHMASEQFYQLARQRVRESKRQHELLLAQSAALATLTTTMPGTLPATISCQ